MGRHQFINPHVGRADKTLWDFVLWHLGYYEDPKPKHPQPEDFIYPATPQPYTKEAPSAMWIGHSTYLIEIGGLHILTDPVWDSYCSPIPIKGLRRYSEPPLLLADLPPIDIVLISHNHYDHLDQKTVMALHRLHPQIHWIVPERLSPWFLRRGINNVTEVSWWKEHQVKNCKITAVPTQHFSGRTLWDTNATHWNGYVLEVAGKKIYFVGDTGFNDHDFKAIGKKFGSMDLSMIPIGTYVPKEFMSPIHVCPKEAVQIHQEVSSKLSLGMHWNTFRLSDEPAERPPFDLFLAMEEKNLPFQAFLPVDIGVRVNF